MGEKQADLTDDTKGLSLTIRVGKEDSAWVYALLESMEGVALPTTLDAAPGCPSRDLSLSYTKGFEQELRDLLDSLGECVYEPKTV